jgi:hypothetical protein
LWATSNFSAQNIYKLDFDLDYVRSISSNASAGDLIAVNDSIALVNIGCAVICKMNFKSGRFLDTLDNALMYEKIQSKLKSTEFYKEAEFFSVKDIGDITTCNGYYIQFQRIIRLDFDRYACEVRLQTKNFGVLSVILQINQNLDIEEIKVVENTLNFGVSHISLNGYYEMNDELFIRSGLINTSVFDKNTPCYFSRFEFTGDYYKFSGFLGGVKHGKKNVYTSKFHSFFYNNERLCTTNGWEIFCFEDSLQTCEYNLDLGLSADEVYTNIWPIDEGEYIAVRKNLNDIGAAINDCTIELLDGNFKVFDKLIQFNIQKTDLGSFDFHNGIAYLYLHNFEKEMILWTLKVEDYREKRG